MDENKLNYLYELFGINGNSEHAKYDLILEMARRYVPAFGSVKEKMSYEKSFDEFWQKCPKSSRRAGRHRPLQMWRKMTLVERASAMAVVNLWCEFENKKEDPSLVPHLATWLNQKRWEAFEEALNDGNH